MAKILCVGDMHLKKGQMAEVEPLLAKIAELSHKHDYTVLMGDLHDEHGIIRADVLMQSDKFLRSLKKPFNLEGNHDLLADQSASSLYTLSGAEIINQPRVVGWGNHSVLLMPFFRDNNQFCEALRSAKKMNPDVKYVFCHQDFNGAQYANGFYSPHGVDPKILDELDLQIISGHIHQPQSFGRIFYTGSPRWLNRGDSNQLRGVWSVDLDNFKPEFISSEDVSPVYRTIEIADTSELPNYPVKDKIVVVYHGESDQKIKDIKAQYGHVSIQKVTKKVKTVQVSEKASLRDSVVNFVSKRVDKDKADQLLQEIFKRIQL